MSAAACAVLVWSAGAAAQGRPDARQMTCQQVQSLIGQRGAVVLTTGRHTYDRYVAGRRLCDRGARLDRDFISTRDNARCDVYRCTNLGFWEPGDLW